MVIGLFLRHIKAYKGIKYIPIGSKYNYVSYIGANGSGKSSILEALDSFFNLKPYLINKSALNDGIQTLNNDPYIAPIFLVEKSKIVKQKKNFELISDFFWSVSKKDLTAGVKGSMKEFFDLRDEVKKDKKISKETHYLLIMGEINLLTSNKTIYFGSFQNEEIFLRKILNKGNKEINSLEKKNIILEWKTELNNLLNRNEWKRTLQEIKNIYSYVYLPVELDVQSFTKIETNEMQKIFDKTLKDEIENALESVNFDRSGGINSKLDSFISEIEKILNEEYIYSTGQLRNNKVTKADITNKIIEVYFQKRILYKKDGEIEKKVSELSAGEKRQALINLLHAFLIKDSKRDKMVIIGIDEPENSLHTSVIYDQFEKLKEIAKNTQIFITTHWYGFLPIISEGYGHFLNLTDEKINFITYDLYDYRSKIKKDIDKSNSQFSSDFMLKSTYDLVQSIFYSIKNSNAYNWIICEGVSEKIYFEYFFKDLIIGKKLRILPMGGQRNVIRLFKYLEVPLEDLNGCQCLGKIFCLIDTDVTRCEEINKEHKNLVIKKLSNKNSNHKTELLRLNHSDNTITDIEQSLNPEIFKETIESLQTEEKYKITQIVEPTGNTSFIKNMKNMDIEDYFKEKEGENKIIFAKEYVKIMSSKDNVVAYIPDWINIMKKYFTE